MTFPMSPAGNLHRECVLKEFVNLRDLWRDSVAEGTFLAHFTYYLLSCNVNCM